MFYPDFDRSYAESLAKQFELPLNKKINGLSTGYGSIFRLILGLSVNTPYVLFDEPVLGLDAQHRDLFYKLLVQKYAEHPCTMVVSTHLIAEVAGPHRAHGHHPEGTHPAGRAHGRADRRLLGGVRPCRGGGQLGRRAGRVYILCAGRTQDRLHPGRGDRGPAAGLERRRVGLQEYFISLMEEEDQR